NIPFSVIGGIVALWITGIYLSVSAAIGFIALFGQSVLNGVVMVALFNELREAGIAPEKAVVSGAITRLRTVLMTALLASLGLARILEAEGYALEVAGRGEEAVGAARGERFDLVILDIGLPGMDGFEVLRRLRGAEHRVPVLVLTARDTVSDRVHGLDLGADD